MMRMFSVVLSKIFGSRNDRVIKQCQKLVDKINSLEPSITALTDEELLAKTAEFKGMYSEGSTLEELLPEAFAVVREASMRVLKMRHFDVQLIGGYILHQGKVAEMCTGEGKTLASTLPAYLNALTGLGVHIVTVNDYLAKRDSDWMKPVYEFLGMTVGVIYTDQDHAEKQAAYRSDIIYGTNNEFGFDYLRDNMAFNKEEKVQGELSYAIVDEVDSILIDEARTPLIISGAAEDSSALYKAVNNIVPQLTKQEDKDAKGHFFVDEKNKQVFLSEEGHLHVEELLVTSKMIAEGESLYDASNIILMHHLNAGLRAHALFSKDVDYIVTNNEVVIIDEHTGRSMPGRRWSDGLHQAVEAKENVAIQNENQTLASITFQNFFRLYNKLSGMTGTADTEAFELQQIYSLEVVVIPTNRPVTRKDFADLVYMSADEKFDAIVEDIEKSQKNNNPVLVGTVSIEVSEYLAKRLRKDGIKHSVLNAKFHEKEADIIAQAGRPGFVTIATNMAGRGTDIVLGGNIEKDIQALSDPSEEQINALREKWKERNDTVLKAGGLRVIGTERHESRRIDNQLRGRSGRQGDAGSSTFYLSLEDNLLRIFAAGRIKGVMKRFGMEKGSALESGLLSRCIENAQRRVEAHNFDIRKQLLEYDDVANDQRQVVYEQRARLMDLVDLSETIATIQSEVLTTIQEEYLPPKTIEDHWDIPGLEGCLASEFGLHLDIGSWIKNQEAIDPEGINQRVILASKELIASKENQVGAETMRQFEKSVMLHSLDTHWKEHLAAMDHLRQSIHLRGYAQKNPKQEFKREAYNIFTDMLWHIKREVIAVLSSFQIKAQEDVEVIEEQRRQASNYTVNLHHDSAQSAFEGGEEADAEAAGSDKQAPFVRDNPKVGRNESCPCGSGKKYKQCHGKL
jgi:preprotein translocase subunit SecA